MDIRSMLFLICIIPATVGSLSFMWLIFCNVLSMIFSWSNSISYFFSYVGIMPATFLSSIIPYFLQITIISIFVVLILSSSGSTGGYGRDGDGE